MPTTSQFYDNNDFPEIRVRVPKDLYHDLRNIAINSAETMSSICRPKLREIANNAPPDMKRDRSKD